MRSGINLFSAFVFLLKNLLPDDIFPRWNSEACLQCSAYTSIMSVLRTEYPEATFL